MEHFIPPKPRHYAMFFTVSLRQPGSDLLILNRDRLLRAVHATQAERPFQINAMVILPDHLHAVWTLPDTAYAARWRLIKARFSAGLPKGKGVWQPRLWAQPLISRPEFDRHIRACRMDPVRHGLVDEADAWPYSSFQTGLAQVG